MKMNAYIRWINRQKTRAIMDFPYLPDCPVGIYALRYKYMLIKCYIMPA